ncbi:hypothetical protein [uncultured Roseobacter sp.]|uniref:hypothetical protein n=1 Tax=uncultured Roseobacter sp. TaxID=114847 RepID=UPI00261157DC|nr:hypothetical protein [uncultured Roseobacter sp.]
MIRFLPMAIAAALVSGCVPLETRTVELTPDFYDIHVTNAFLGTGPAAPILSRSPLLPDVERVFWEDSGGLEDRGALVGFATDLNKGADPFPRDIWRWSVYQAKILFDFGDLPDNAIVREAMLDFEDVFRPNIPIDEYPQREGVTNGCDLRVSEATEALVLDRTSGLGTDGLLPSRAARPDAFYGRGERNPLDITGTVFQWVEGNRDNNGLLVTPV